MVSIVEVTTKAQLRRFVDYPNQLYRGVPQFVQNFASAMLSFPQLGQCMAFSVPCDLGRRAKCSTACAQLLGSTITPMGEFRGLRLQTQGRC